MILILFVLYSEFPEEPVKKKIEKNEKDVERITCGKVLRASSGIILIILSACSCS